LFILFPNADKLINPVTPNEDWQWPGDPNYVKTSQQPVYFLPVIVACVGARTSPILIPMPIKKMSLSECSSNCNFNHLPNLTDAEIETRRTTKD
jgi:hypothetical protein